MLFGSRKKLEMPARQAALPGRPDPIATASKHFVSGRPLKGPYPKGSEIAYFALGCYWGAEKAFWTVAGVWVTAVGSIGGFTPNPTYEEVCTGLTGHAEAVKAVYDPTKVSYEDLLKVFWEAHDPTQGMRQGNDVGTNYRSGIYWSNEAQKRAAEESRTLYQTALKRQGHGEITTEIAPAGEFYYAEEHHQQYLAKNPYGYCGLGGTGVACQIGTGVTA
jgi:peptide-methionine (S)-S-oxide reductase